jgi:hypothetical protein
MIIFDTTRLTEFVLSHKGCSKRQIPITFYRLKIIESNIKEMTLAENKIIIDFAKNYSNWIDFLKKDF